MMFIQKWVSILVLGMVACAGADIVVSEDFEVVGLPSGWKVVDNSTGSNNPAFSNTTGHNGTGGNGGQSGHIGDNIDIGPGSTPGGWLQAPVTVLGSSTFSVTADFRIDNEGSVDDAGIYLGDLDGRQYYLIIFAADGQYANNEVYSATASSRTLLLDDYYGTTAFAQDKWYSVTLTWTPMSGTTGNLSMNIVDPATALYVTGFTDLSMNMTNVQFGFGTFNDRASFDNVVIQGVVAPQTATYLHPSNQASGVACFANLSWRADANAASHDVYFGTSPTPPFAANQTATVFEPGTLQPNTTYYWQVNERNGDETVAGPVWQFQTGAAGSPDYATWLMIWVSSSESWWIDEHYHGITTPRDGTWKSSNWNNAGWRQDVYADLEDAGINVIITDNTNNGFMGRTGTIHTEIHSKGTLKLAIALAGSHLNVATDPTYVDQVWDNHAKHLILKNSYYYMDGKPVLVCYVTQSMWNALKDSTDRRLTRFKLLWASGEDSAANKCGWQLEPQDNVVPSHDVMFVTNSLKHASGDHDVAWRKSQAHLDYGFRQVQLYNPRLVVVGSYDDVTEQNSWFPMDMTNADALGRKFFDSKSGLLADPYYLRNRVEQWIKYGQPQEVPGGVLRDGIYRLKNVGTGNYMKVTTDYNPNTPVVGGGLSAQTYDEFGIYHLGNNEYRIENAYSGWAIRMTSSTDNTTLLQGEHESSYQSLFKLISAGSSRTYHIQSQLSGKYLRMTYNWWPPGYIITQQSLTSANSQKWVIEPAFYDRGDLTLDGQIDMQDIFELIDGWLIDYDLNTFHDIALDWLR